MCWGVLGECVGSYVGRVCVCVGEGVVCVLGVCGCWGVCVVWVCWCVCGVCGVCGGFRGEKVSLAPLYYPDTLINPDTCLGVIFSVNKNILCF